MLDTLFSLWQGSKKLKGNNIQEWGEVSSEDQVFLDEAAPQIEMAEQFRVEQYEAFLARRKLVLPVLIVIFLLFVGIMFFAPAVAVAVGSFGAVALGAWVYWPKILYTKLYKDKIIPEIIKLFGDFEYISKGKIAPNKMQPSQIIPQHDEYTTDDYFIGKYKGCEVEFCEAVFEKEHKQRGRDGDDDKVIRQTVFRGLLILINMKTKKFYGHTVLDKDHGKVMQWLKQKTSKFKRANLVDPEFEKIFDVFTTDQVEARYLIDPLIMGHFIELYEEYDGKGMKAAFFDKQLLIMVESDKNFFEPANIEIPATDPRSILTMKNEIHQILSIIDRLNLYDPSVAHEKSAKAVSGEDAA